MKQPHNSSHPLPRLLAPALALLALGSGFQTFASDDSDDHAQHKQAGAMQAIDPNDPHAHHRQQAAAAQAAPVPTEIDLPTGLPLLDQFGKSVDLQQDVIGERIVVIDFVYTNCSTVCPVVSSIFSLLQKRLGERMDEEVTLVTITVDPTRDTPHRMLEYSKNFNHGTSWSWLTGDKKHVDKLLIALGAYTPLFEDHPAMVLIGDEKSGTWYRCACRQDIHLCRRADRQRNDPDQRRQD